MRELMQRRRRRLGPNVPTFYRAPLHLVRGEGVWLWDADGMRYLDAYNNVPHVGHCHPKVAEAITRQMATLNVHSRYLHDGILDYAERLGETFDPSLSAMLFTCTGSEAMDVALRMAQAATGKTGVIATDNTYHGNTTAVAQLSTRRPPMGGRGDHIRLVPAPEGPGDAATFAANVAAAVDALEAAGHGVSALVICPVFANEGLPGVAPGWLDSAVRAVHKADGLVICDEVQPGLGRLGSHWWGHQLVGITPEVVVMGKPLGNGYPVAGAVASDEVMQAFRGAFGYFNTFAATPVAAAAGNAVLDVMKEEGLMENAAQTGAHMAALLADLSHPAIARVTGHGLMFAVELAGKDDGTPDPALAEAVEEGMKARGVLIGRIGRHQHILKLRPPLPFSAAHAAQAVSALDEALAQTQVPA